MCGCIITASTSALVQKHRGALWLGHLLACASSLLLSCQGSCACMLLFWCISACSLWLRALWCGLSSRGFAAGNACNWSTRTAASVGCGWHQPTSHCVCPLNFCLFSGNYGGLTKCVHAQPSPLLPGRGWAGAPKAISGLCGSTGACMYIQLIAIPVGVAVCAAVHEGAG
jgi:hypothetical protein